jgi:hypothetical protein
MEVHVKEISILCSAHDNVLLDNILKMRSSPLSTATVSCFLVEEDMSSFEFWQLQAVCLLPALAGVACSAQHTHAVFGRVSCDASSVAPSS